jgi:hypothetical protein
MKACAAIEYSMGVGVARTPDFDTEAGVLLGAGVLLMTGVLLGAVDDRSTGVPFAALK